jgi:hypothetical protein
VLLVVGYFMAAILAVMIAFGGLGAAVALVKLGRGETIAQWLLAAIFVNASAAAVLLGIGVSPAFSEAALRRYPLSRIGRFVARHATGLLEPLWLLVLSLLTGLAIGFRQSSHASLSIGLSAAVLFVGATYLFAAALRRVVIWIQTLRIGPIVMVGLGSGLLIVAPLVPAFLARATASGSSAIAGLAALRLTPPFAAAAGLAGSTPASQQSGLLLLVVSVLALAGLLLGAERLPEYARARVRGPAPWNDPWDRAAAMFGRSRAPLAAKVLRYYARSPIRYNYLLCLPTVGLLLLGHGRTHEASFLFALGAAPAVGFASTIPVSMNIFGFDGHGIRRYFLLPASATNIFRTIALVSLVPGCVIVLLGTIGWLLWSPLRADGRTLIMLLSSGLGGLLVFHAFGLGASLVSPRTIPFAVAFGNKLSPGANALMLLAMGTIFGVPMVLTTVGFARVMAGWRLAPIFLVTAVLFYSAALEAGARAFARRRELIVALIEAGT